MTWIDITCAHCDEAVSFACMALPTQPCRDADGDVLAIPHPERIEQAAAMNRGGDVSKEEFDRAVDVALGGLL